AFVNVLDNAKDGKELGLALVDISKSAQKASLVQRLQEDTEVSNTNRLAALTLLTGLQNSRVQEMCRRADDRTMQTAVASLLAQVPENYSPKLEEWLRHSLNSKDEFSADNSYFLTLCLGMAYQSKNPRLQSQAGEGFWHDVVEQYKVHPDAGVHSGLRLLLVINRPNELRKIDDGLRDSRGENVALRELKM